jgi:hypothetical protein
MARIITLILSDVKKPELDCLSPCNYSADWLVGFCNHRIPAVRSGHESIEYTSAMSQTIRILGSLSAQPGVYYLLS